MPPNKLTIQSDGNTIELIRTIKTKTGTDYEYQFTKSETKLGMTMTMSEEHLTKNLKNKIFTCEEN